MHLSVPRIQDKFYLQLLKFYYNLCSDVLPPYFEMYRESIDINDEDSGDPHYDMRTNAHPLIRIYLELIILLNLVYYFN